MSRGRDAAARTLTVFVNQPDVYRDVDFARFPQIGTVHWEPPAPREREGVDVILTGFRDVIDDRFLADYPNVRIVGSNTTGTDHIRPAARAVTVVHLQARDVEEISATAEFTLGLLLAVARRFPFIDYHRLGDWTSECRGTQLAGKTIGILGFGRLGKKMARYTEALGMTVLRYDKESTPDDKDHLLRASDVISIHLPLNAETVDFIGDREFDAMARRPFVVNTARPQIIRKTALIRALRERLVAGVAMDFINYDATTRVDPDLEPFTSSNLLLTPHMGGNTHESVAFTAEVIVKKIAAEA